MICQPGQVSLGIYNIKGALVEQLFKESKVAGEHHYRWIPNEKLSSGLYFFELKTRMEPDIKKLLTLNRENNERKILCNYQYAVYKCWCFAQGVSFPSDPVQAPIGGLGLLALGGVAIAYKRFKKYQIVIKFINFIISSSRVDYFTLLVFILQVRSNKVHYSEHDFINIQVYSSARF